MSYWGKIIGGVAGFAMGGPVGALFGAALGHAADQGALPNVAGRLGNSIPFDSARLAAMLGRREQLFAVSVTVLAAKLAKCDGQVNRAEIDAFKRSFRIPDENVREVGRMFDQARGWPRPLDWPRMPRAGPDKAALPPAWRKIRTRCWAWSGKRPARPSAPAG